MHQGAVSEQATVTVRGVLTRTTETKCEHPKNVTICFSRDDTIKNRKASFTDMACCGNGLSFGQFSLPYFCFIYNLLRQRSTCYENIYDVPHGLYKKTLKRNTIVNNRRGMNLHLNHPRQNMTLEIFCSIWTSIIYTFICIHYQISNAINITVIHTCNQPQMVHKKTEAETVKQTWLPDCTLISGDNWWQWNLQRELINLVALSLDYFWYHWRDVTDMRSAMRRSCAFTLMAGWQQYSQADRTVCIIGR
jgi:hypothetical protein